MEEFVPATGRVLRYWYDAFASRCKHRLYDYLGVQPSDDVGKAGSGSRTCWVKSEVWTQPEPGHERTVIIEVNGADVQVPRLNKRVRLNRVPLTKSVQRRPGLVLNATFQCTRTRLGRGPNSSTGLSLI